MLPKTKLNLIRRTINHIELIEELALNFEAEPDTMRLISELIDALTCEGMSAEMALEENF